MSQSAKAVAESLRPGDIFKATATFRVASVVSDWYEIADVADAHPARVSLHELTRGSLKLEIVKKARRQRQQFDVGDVITSDTLREVMWLRGTVIEAVSNGAAFVLRGDGKWHDLLGPDRDCECVSGWAFEDFAGDYRLVRRP